MPSDDVSGRWAPYRMRPFDRICAKWLILHKVDNNDQMQCALRLPHTLPGSGVKTLPRRPLCLTLWLILKALQPHVTK